jgi:hypothetical protein
MRGGRYAAAGGTVSFVAAGNYRIDVSIFCALSVPTGTVVGDLLVASTMSRSTTLTPTGWTKQVERQESSSTSQRTIIFTKVADAGDLGSSINFRQVSSNRFLGQMLSFRKSTGSPSVLSAATSLQTSPTAHDLAVVTGTADDQMAVVAGSFIYAESSSSTTITVEAYNTSLPFWNQTTTEILGSNRLGVAYQAVQNGQTTSGKITTSYNRLSQAPQVAVLLG